MTVIEHMPVRHQNGLPANITRRIESAPWASSAHNLSHFHQFNAPRAEPEWTEARCRIEESGSLAIWSTVHDFSVTTASHCQEYNRFAGGLTSRKGDMFQESEMTIAAIIDDTRPSEQYQLPRFTAYDRVGSWMWWRYGCLYREKCW